MANYRAVDLDSMSWEPWHPQFEGTFAKTLYVDAETGANLRQAFLPSGFTLSTWARHHHGATREGVFVLFGNVQYLEFQHPTVVDGGATNFREGFLLDRPPRSIHGPKIDAVTELGCLILEWGSGPLEFNYIPFEGDLASYGDEYYSPLVVDSDCLAWELHPKISGLKIKHLSSGQPNPEPGFHPINLVYVPPGWAPSAKECAVVAETKRRWLYVLHGSVDITVCDSAQSGEEMLSLKKNSYLEWFLPSQVSMTHQQLSEIGCILLCVGHDLS